MILIHNFLQQLTGSSEATAIEAIGKAEAERMRQKAAAYKMYGDAAMTALVLEALPKVQSYFLSVECKRVTFFIKIQHSLCTDAPPPLSPIFFRRGGFVHRLNTAELLN